MNAEPTAGDRLALSRERLRLAMQGSRGPANSAANPAAQGAPGAWIDGLKTALPGAGIAVDALRAWWAQHPLRIAVTVAAGATAAVARPLAQRHPIGLVVCTLLLGGLFAWSRPWRWMLKPALFAGLLPQIVAKTAAQVPVQSWLAALAALTQAPQRPHAPVASAPPPTHAPST